MIKKDKWAWGWVPPLYFAEGLPNVIIASVSVIMYKQLGINNTDITLYTGLLYLPWVLKPIWSPVVDLKSTKRNWFLVMQLLIAVMFLAVGLTVPTQMFFVTTLACFWVAAFASATNDIASDGYYMIGLSEKNNPFSWESEVPSIVWPWLPVADSLLFWPAIWKKCMETIPKHGAIP